MAFDGVLEGRSGGEGQEERERERERHGFIEIQRERKCEVCI